MISLATTVAKKAIHLYQSDLYGVKEKLSLHFCFKYV